MTKSTVADNCQIYTEIEANQSQSLSNHLDMGWLIPLVGCASSLHDQFSGKNGQPPQDDLIDIYNDVIKYIALRLMKLPSGAMEIAKPVVPDFIWSDIAEAIVIN
jgi:hypothetical protein